MSILPLNSTLTMQAIGGTFYGYPKYFRINGKERFELRNRLAAEERVLDEVTVSACLIRATPGAKRKLRGNGP
ncbi:hypothetical protein SBA4_2110008 [Candidatus Sulfopaludibacter sp. SbA4]|nr:hypothetical protein SBA4_2110008 [Candidatus Sulfopaludibacter sp. SbA4]